MFKRLGSPSSCEIYVQNPRYSRLVAFWRRMGAFRLQEQVEASQLLPLDSIKGRHQMRCTQALRREPITLLDRTRPWFGPDYGNRLSSLWSVTRTFPWPVKRGYEHTFLRNEYARAQTMCSTHPLSGETHVRRDTRLYIDISDVRYSCSWAVLQTHWSLRVPRTYPSLGQGQQTYNHVDQGQSDTKDYGPNPGISTMLFVEILLGASGWQ